MRFRLRLILAISLLIAVAFGIGGSLLITTSFQSAVTEEKAAALDSYETIRNTLYLLNSLGDQRNYKNLAKSLEQMNNQQGPGWVALNLTATSQEVVIYSDGSVELLQAELAVPASDTCAYTVTEQDGNYYLRAVSGIPTGDTTLVLDACFDISNSYEARERQERLYLIIYLAVVLLGVLVAAVISFNMTKHLNRLTITAKRIAAGDLSKRSKIRTKDEVGQLAAAFDSMADHLQENIAELQDNVRRQEAFMGAFAHELKTPMTSIIGYADLLRQDVLEPHDRIAAARYIFSEGQRLEKLSFQLLDLLLMEKDKLSIREVSIPALVSEIEHALAPVMRGKGIRLVCRGSQGKIGLDPDLIKSLLYNLIDNASKAIEGGGVVALAVKKLPDGCLFQVMDNGRGMTGEELRRVTEPFYRADKSRSRAQGGAGLGLALCSKIVELHQGTLTFSSTPGKGTSVTVIIPDEKEGLHESL